MKNEKAKILTDRILSIGYHSLGRKPVVWKAYNATAQILEIELETLMEPEFRHVRNLVERAAVLSREAAYNEEAYMEEAYAKNDKRKVEQAQERVGDMYEEFSRRVEYNVKKAILSFEESPRTI